MPVKSKRPYLIRALNEWIVDSDLTPHLMVDATAEDVRVPQDFVSGGKIVLNIAMVAVRDLILGDDVISFSARFSGKSFDIHVPVASVIAVYARETGEGMMFDEEQTDPARTADAAGDSSNSANPPDDDPDKPGSHLKLVT